LASAKAGRFAVLVVSWRIPTNRPPVLLYLPSQPGKLPIARKPTWIANIRLVVLEGFVVDLREMESGATLVLGKGAS